jgi:hypothetical protein
MTQLKQNSKFDSISIGDELPPFEIVETQETMDRPSENTRIPNVAGMRPKKIFIMMQTSPGSRYLVRPQMPE